MPSTKRKRGSGRLRGPNGAFVRAAARVEPADHADDEAEMEMDDSESSEDEEWREDGFSRGTEVGSMSSDVDVASAQQHPRNTKRSSSMGPRNGGETCREDAVASHPGMPHRSTTFRRRKAVEAKENQDMAQSLANWLQDGKTPSRQKPTGDDVAGSIKMDHSYSIETSFPPEISPMKNNNSSGSSDEDIDLDGEVMICSGDALPLEYWGGQAEMAGVESLSWMDSDVSDDTVDSCDEYAKTGSKSEANDGHMEDNPQESGATALPTDSDVHASLTRRSGRKCRFAGSYRSEHSRSGRRQPANVHRGGRFSSKLLPDEVCSRDLERSRKRTKKGRRLRRLRLREEGSVWTKEERAKEQRESAELEQNPSRSGCTQREEMILDTYRKGLERIQEADRSKNLVTIVEDETQLSTTQVVNTVRVVIALQAYFKLELHEGVSKVSHGEAVGRIVGVSSRTVRHWAKSFCANNEFVIHRRTYCKRHPFTYIDDEDIRERCREWIDRRVYRRQRNETRFRIEDFRRWVNGVLLKEEVGDGRGISRSAAHRWIQELGFIWNRHTKCVYVDGHNRPDVVEARKDFVSKMRVLQKTMAMPVKVEDRLESGKTVKHEALAWPASRVVDGSTEYKHVRIHENPEQMPRNSSRSLAEGTKVALDPRDVEESDGHGRFRLLPDHEVRELFFHDETTMKENDDGACLWMSKDKGAPIKKKGEGRAVHVSDVIGATVGPLQLGKEYWGMLQEDRAVEEDVEHVSAEGPPSEQGERPMAVAYRQYYGRSGQYRGRKEGEGDEGLEWKDIQAAVEILKAVPQDCGVKRTGNDPSTAAVVMTVGARQDGYWTCDRMCSQLPGIFAIAELIMDSGQQGVFIFDNSTGHAAFDEGALLAQNLSLKPGGEQPNLDPFLDDDGNPINPVFREGDTLLYRTKVYARKAGSEKDAANKAKHGEYLGEFRERTVLRRGDNSERLIGVPKGAKQMLMEMDLWKGTQDRPGIRVLTCKTCHNENKAIRETISAFNRGGQERQDALNRAESSDGQSGDDEGGGRAMVNRRRCCARKVFSEMKAFKNVLNKVETICKKAGHLCVFLPKYHPELNAIERYWGYLKNLLRLRCEYSLPLMLKILPEVMVGVPVDFVRAWARVSWLYIDAYDEGLVDYLQYRDLKAWKTHRSATGMGDAVVAARAQGKSDLEKRQAEERALEAAREVRVASGQRAARVFANWKRARTARRHLLRLVIGRAWRCLKKV